MSVSRTEARGAGATEAVSGSLTEAPDDPELVWIAIQEAVQEHRDAELAEIAFSLYAQLGVARAEIGRLRATLQSSLRALAPTRLGGWELSPTGALRALRAVFQAVMAASLRRTPA